jgi:hypothetical protein
MPTDLGRLVFAVQLVPLRGDGESVTVGAVSVDLPVGDDPRVQSAVAADLAARLADALDRMTRSPDVV